MKLKLEVISDEETRCAWCGEVIKKAFRYNGDLICFKCNRNRVKDTKIRKELQNKHELGR